MVPAPRVQPGVDGAADRHRRGRPELRRPASDRPRPRRISRLASALSAPDRRMNPMRHLTAAAAVVAALVLVACSPDAGDFKSEAEKYIESREFSEKAELLRYSDAECEEPESTAEDTRYTCTASAEDGTQWRFIVEITGESDLRVLRAARTRVGVARRVLGAGSARAQRTGRARRRRRPPRRPPGRRRRPPPRGRRRRLPHPRRRAPGRRRRPPSKSQQRRRRNAAIGIGERSERIPALHLSVSSSSRRRRVRLEVGGYQPVHGPCCGSYGTRPANVDRFAAEAPAASSPQHRHGIRERRQADIPASLRSPNPAGTGHVEIAAARRATPPCSSRRSTARRCR